VSLSTAILALLAVSGLYKPAPPARAETCLSPFIKRLDRPEKYLYVACSSLDGKHNDFVAVLDVDMDSANYGKMIYQLDLGSQGNELHHWGFTDDRTRIWACGLFSDRVFIVDVAANPARPKLEKVIDVGAEAGLSGPHTAYALPGRMLLTFLSGKGGSLPAGLGEFTNDGQFIRRLDLPREAPYMHDVSIKPELNRMVTSGFTPASNYKLPLAQWDMKNAGKDLLVWDFKERKILQTIPLGAAPFEVRWSLKPGNPRGYVMCLFDDTLWAWQGNESGQYTAVKLGRTAKMPSDLKQSPDDRFLYVSCYGAHEIQQWDVSDINNARLTSTVTPGAHPHMIHISSDGKRLYLTNNLLSTVDASTQYWIRLARIGPDGMKMDPFFNIDLTQLPTGPARAHDMLLY
jgi:selenium-binding protein 1